MKHKFGQAWLAWLIKFKPSHKGYVYIEDNLITVEQLRALDK